MKLVLLAALATVLYLSTLGESSLLAQETVNIRGRVVNGTEGAALPAELNVLMLITGPDGILGGTGQTMSDSQGRFIFEGVPVREGDIYTISVEHMSVFYGTSLDGGGLADELLLTVYEPTQDASIIRVERQVMVIAAVDKNDRLVSAIEFVRIMNPTDRTLLPDLTNVAPISFLRFALPPGTTELTVQSDLPGGDVASIGTGFALTSPVIPGAHSIDFSYSFPYDGDTLSYRQSLVQGADIFQVLVPETIPNMAVPGLNNIDPVNIQGTIYRAYEGREFPPGKGLQLQITGLPMPGVWARFSNTVSGGAFWQVTIPSALGVTLAAMLLWGLIRGYRPSPTICGGSIAATTVGPAERAAVVRAVAALDQRYQDGGVTEADYQAQRQKLMARVLDPTIGSTPPGQDEEPDGERPE